MTTSRVDGPAEAAGFRPRLERTAVGLLGVGAIRAIRRITFATRIGLVLFIAAPTLCVGLLVADYSL